MIDPGPLPVQIAGDNSDLDDEFLARVQTCFKSAMSGEELRDGNIWKDYEQRNLPFVEALRHSDPSLLRPFVETLFANDVLLGMGHVQRFVRGRKTIYPRAYFGMRVRDSVMSLAEALAITGPHSNQQTSLSAYRNALSAELGPLIEKIEDVLGHSVATPEIGCPPGAEIDGRLFNPDLLRHAYVPHRLRQLNVGNDDPVLEIGGGYGVVARYGYLGGHRAWTIVDLPYVNAIQMLWLGATIGPDAVSGHGEARAAIHLHPSTDKAALDRPISFALNMDSLPEIPAEEAARYLDLICTRADRFLSVNQEARARPRGGTAQNSIPEMMRNRPMHRASRHPYWMEQGYVEELYVAAHGQAGV